MNHDQEKKDTSNCEPPATVEQTIVPVLKLNPEEYRSYLEEFDMTIEQQDELLEVLWNIMRCFVDIGWGLNSVQLLSVADDDFSDSDSGKRLKVKHTEKFNQATMPKKGESND